MGWAAGVEGSACGARSEASRILGRYPPHHSTIIACKRKGPLTMTVIRHEHDSGEDDLTPAAAARTLLEYIENELNANMPGAFTLNGDPVRFEVTVRIKNPVPSPEETGIYECPSCGQTDRFVGYDERACTRQDFHFRDGDVEYDAYEDCGDPSPYSLIRCGAPLCDAIIWVEYLA